MQWIPTGQHEYEVTDEGVYTGWFRCIQGQLPDGRWPYWNRVLGITRLVPLIPTEGGQSYEPVAE